jgi:hypothetical protein
METVEIPNDATYSPVSLTDVAMVAPLLSRIALGATLPGQLLQAVALSAYATSAIQDWVGRLGIRRIDFMAEFGADLSHLDAMSDTVREAETVVLAERLNDGYSAERPSLPEMAPEVNRHLTAYMAGITGQRVETSAEVRTNSLVQFLFPFAQGAADIFSGDIAIFHDTGPFQPHVLAHEFCHRKGYWRELDAQALAYLAMTASDEPPFVQAALCERLYRDLRVRCGTDEDKFDAAVRALGLRAELETSFLGVRPELGPLATSFSDAMRELYDMRMKLTGQNGLSDYDLGFTNFLYTFETSERARQRPPAAGALR